MSNIPTPHIGCDDKSKIAKTVLMPGDPLRAKFIADNFLKDVITFTTVRNVLGYTGYYNNKRISVMASGMGMPSIGIYSYELYSFYDVENIIRIGSCGSYKKEFNVYDTLLVSEAYSESSYAMVAFGYKDNVMMPSLDLNLKLKGIASSLNIKLKEAKVHSSDVFYHAGNEYLDNIINVNNCDVVEMESFALFANAKYLNKKAACLLTVSDSFVTNEVTTSKQREIEFVNMMKIALELAKE